MMRLFKDNFFEFNEDMGRKGISGQPLGIPKRSYLGGVEIIY
jgi:hypothetical protein